ncbi:MAG: glutamate synthase small subunit [Candidatus Omnitrophica bacterium]|nr:glutamate synthase small subunit [Candidatus Omnitrophota bacterium]MBD3269330.1 glutamate synthase small subunit [Candidatus Omnitrophota bacterium]
MKKDTKAFIGTKRKESLYRPVCERVKDYREVEIMLPEEHIKEQAHRCMDCGTPFCHWACPVGNYIPEWNDACLQGQWEKAARLLSATNNLAEITGRVCPALCEYSCVLGFNDDPVTIRRNELAVIENAYKKGYVAPLTPARRTGRNVAIIGSGPAGLSAAMQLNRAGHQVTVFEKDDSPGGILRYGIPDFKLEKHVLDRRLGLMRQEGVIFKTGVEAGKDVAADKILKKFDALILATGSRVPRDLKIPGRDLKGIYFAMDYLTQSNKRVAGYRIEPSELINAEGKKVIIIGGGDTGSDCVGTAHRQGASCVVQLEVMPKPGECRTESCPWPGYPLLLKNSTSHQEGGRRYWSVLTKEFRGSNSKVKKIFCRKVEFERGRDPSPVMKEIEGTDFEIDADLVIIAVGFLGSERGGLIEELGLELSERKNILTGTDFMTSRQKIFAAGDSRRGQSLVVWAISEGRRVAHTVDKYLMGRSVLPSL